MEKGKEKNVAKLSNYTDEQQGGEVRNSWRLRQTNTRIYHLLRVANETKHISMCLTEGYRSGENE